MNTQTVDPANEYAWRTVIQGGESWEDVDPEEEAYWESLLVWMEANHA